MEKKEIKKILEHFYNKHKKELSYVNVKDFTGKIEDLCQSLLLR